MPKPLKRCIALQPVSREHHYGLLLAWKIREGFKHEIAAERIKRYTDWFWENQLQDHFEFEETYIFPILGAEHELIKKAMREHRRLKRLFSVTDKVAQHLSLLEEELVAHIRFEERVVFEEIQKVATSEELATVEKAHTKVEIEDWGDEFWKK